jgi:predicted transcriptional regulator
MYMNTSYKSLEKLLTQAGVSKSECKVYIAGLEKPLTTSELAEMLPLPRSTITTALKNLQECNLCRSEAVNKRTLRYYMLPVHNLNAYLSAKASGLHEVMEKLSTFQVPDTDMINKTANGQEEVQALLELALRCKTRKWHIIAPKDNPIKFMPKSYTNYFKKIRKERQIESLSLWDKSGPQSLGMYDILMRKPRIVPEKITKKIPCLMLAFDESLLFIEGRDIPQAVLIQNAAIAKTFRIIFEMSWLSAKSERQH